MRRRIDERDQNIQLKDLDVEPEVLESFFAEFQKGVDAIDWGSFGLPPLRDRPIGGALCH